MVLFHSFIVKSNILSSDFSILVASFIQVYQVFKNNIVFTVKSNVYFRNFSIMVVSIIQVYQLSLLCYFIPSYENLTRSFSVINSCQIFIPTFSTLIMGNRQGTQGTYITRLEV